MRHGLELAIRLGVVGSESTALSGESLLDSSPVARCWQMGADLLGMDAATAGDVCNLITMLTGCSTHDMLSKLFSMSSKVMMIFLLFFIAVCI